MRKNILYLDDDDVRHSFWDRVHGPHHNIAHAHDLEEYIKLLDRQKYDIVSLDHDLNENQYRSYLNEKMMTGVHAAAVLGYLAPEWKPDHVIIHSWNKYGRFCMYDILTQDGYKPRIQPFDIGLYTKEVRRFLAQGKPLPQYVNLRWLGIEQYEV